MTLHELITHFEVSKKISSTSYQCKCPVHNDNKASLTISEQQDKLLLHCHAGCDTKDILEAVGLDFKALSNHEPPNWRERLEYGQKKRIEAVYDYRAADGKYLYSKVRFEGKEIRYITIDRENDRYEYCKTSGLATLYRLPELLKAVKDGYPVYIVEGEKDVETLRKLGYTATTAGGVNDWRKEYAQYFTGAKVVILPDNDEPGLQLKDRIIRDLKHYAHSIRWAITSTADKGDVTDYLQKEGHTKEDLERLIEESAENSHLSHLSHSTSMPQNDNSAIFAIFAPIVGKQKKLMPTFPKQCLPDRIRLYVEAVAESLQVPIDMVASFVLVIISLCATGKLWINIKPDWTESLNLYVVIVGRPSERKTPVLKEVIRPVFKYMNEENERRRPDIAEYELKKKIINGRLKTIQDALSRPQKGNKEAKYTIQDALDCQRKLAELKEVSLLKLIVDDITPEALAKVMKENDERMAIISAEGGIFGMMTGRYNNNTNIDIFLKGYSGEYYSSGRIGREDNDLQHPYLTIGLAVQPQVITDIMDNKELRGRGLLARFLYTIPNTRIGSRVYRTKKIDPEIRKEYDTLCETLLSAGDFGEGFERVIKLSSEADALAEEYYQWIEPQLPEEFEEIEDWAGKLHGNTMRIAGLLHVIKHKFNAVSVPVSAETMRSAIEIGKYYLEHSKLAFDIMGLADPQEVKDAKYIISRLETNSKNSKNSKIDSISKRDLYDLCKGHLKTVDEMEPGLQCLVDHGYIAIVTESQGRGRPSEKIYINPEYYKWKEQQQK